VQIQHSCTDSAFGNRYDIIEQLRADGEGKVADPLDRRAINKFVNMLKRHNLAGIQRSAKRRGAFRFYSNNFSFGRDSFDIRGYARCTTAAAYRIKDIIESGIGFLHYFLPDRAVAGNGFAIIERMDDRDAASFAFGDRFS